MVGQFNISLHHEEESMSNDGVSVFLECLELFFRQEWVVRLGPGLVLGFEFCDERFQLRKGVFDLFFEPLYRVAPEVVEPIVLFAAVFPGEDLEE